MKSSINFVLISVLAVLLLSFLSCNEGTELANSTDIGPEYVLSDDSSGTLNFFLAATTLSGTVNLEYGKAGMKEDILSLKITISEIEVHRTGDGDAGWKVLPLSLENFDLIELNGSIWADLISSSNPVPGDYNKIRISVSEALVETESGMFTAQVPGDKIKINAPFSVQEDGTTEITISFDPKASLKSTGSKKNLKYFFNPVLKVTSKVED